MGKCLAFVKFLVPVLSPVIESGDTGLQQCLSLVWVFPFWLKTWQRRAQKSIQVLDRIPIWACRVCLVSSPVCLSLAAFKIQWPREN